MVERANKSGSFSLSLPMHASRDTPEDNNNAGSPTSSCIGGSHPPDMIGKPTASIFGRSSNLVFVYLFIMGLIMPLMWLNFRR
jgi:hypothetical protein